MKLIDGHDVIEHAEVNGEDREFIRKLMDYIEDADVVETKKVCIGQVSFDNEELHEIVNEAVKKLKEEIEPKQGEWLFKEITDDYHITGLCSVCKERRRIDNFCPNCGCRMGGVEDA